MLSALPERRASELSNTGEEVGSCTQYRNLETMCARQRMQPLPRSTKKGYFALQCHTALYRAQIPLQLASRFVLPVCWIGPLLAASTMISRRLSYGNMPSKAKNIAISMLQHDFLRQVDMSEPSVCPWLRARSSVSLVSLNDKHFEVWEEEPKEQCLISWLGGWLPVHVHVYTSSAREQLSREGPLNVPTCAQYCARRNFMCR